MSITKLVRCQYWEKGGVMCLYIRVQNNMGSTSILAPPNGDTDTEKLHETVMEALWDAVGPEGV
jgi:hypothetical protein